MFSMPTASYDLKREIDLQNQRLEEMQITSNSEFKRTSTTTMN